MDARDAIILALADKIYICSRLLTCAAERLGWDNAQVQELVEQLGDSICPYLHEQHKQQRQ